MSSVTSASLSPTQAAELAALVELEARWENLRTAESRTAVVRSTNQDLHGMQRAYEAFRARLAAFNKLVKPGHVPERLLNTPVRLGIWCRNMRDLYLQVEHDPHTRCPVHLMEKAYRCADKIAGRMGKDRPARSAPPGDVETVARELEALSRWCDDQACPEVSTGAPRALSKQ